MSGKIRSEKLRRVVMTVAGVTASGVAVGFFNYSAFGMDPFQVLAHGLWNLTPIGYGPRYPLQRIQKNRWETAPADVPMEDSGSTAWMRTRTVPRVSPASRPPLKALRCRSGKPHTSQAAGR